MVSTSVWRGTRTEVSGKVPRHFLVPRNVTVYFYEVPRRVIYSNAHTHTYTGDNCNNVHNYILDIMNIHVLNTVNFVYLISLHVVIIFFF